MKSGVREMQSSAFSEEFCEIFGDDRGDVVDENTHFCSHSNTEVENDISICTECGCEVKLIEYEAEWRYYGNSDNRTTKDPSRCHVQKESIKNKTSIDKVFSDAGLNIIDSIKREVGTRYTKIVGDNTARGRKRKSIIAACLLYVYRDNGDIRTSEEIRKLFDLSQREMSDGISRYFKTFPQARLISLKPCDFIPRVVKLVGMREDDVADIKNIAMKLYNTNQILNHSGPQSVASAISYMYVRMQPGYLEELGLTRSKFAILAGLSEITLIKLTREAANVYGATIEI
jgi:transcription initiation factor TFIIIB Brf1 subunit/transcription initiation factor TFIIB